MVQKTISDLIYDKFSEFIKKDDLFKNISVDLILAIKEKRCSKNEIESLFKRIENENSGN